jgi:hypothetical protein
MQDLKNVTTLRVETWPISWEVNGSTIQIPNVKNYLNIKGDIESRIEACKRSEPK